MADPTLETFERRARRILGAPDAPPPDADHDTEAEIQAVVMRTGRPLPRVAVFGAHVATRCLQFEAAGADPVGVTPTAAELELARRVMPHGRFEQGSLEAPPLEANTYDAAWLEGVPCRLPKARLPAALEGVHGLLRPGGLLCVRLRVGEGEGLEETPDGPAYVARWQAEEFEQMLSTLDCSLLESRLLPSSRLGTMFRREY
jgi:SAM-dependent methyltransferase